MRPSSTCSIESTFFTSNASVTHHTAHWHYDIDKAADRSSQRADLVSRCFGTASSDTASTRRIDVAFESDARRWIMEQERPEKLLLTSASKSLEMGYQDISRQPQIGSSKSPFTHEDPHLKQSAQQLPPPLPQHPTPIQTLESESAHSQYWCSSPYSQPQRHSHHHYQY